MLRKKPLAVLVVALALALGYLLTATQTLAASEKVLYRFKGSKGSRPVAGLLFDSAGNLYGTTSDGGPHGTGNVFELTPDGNGGWTEKVLHTFIENSSPASRLIFDAVGNLYGTTFSGGSYGAGRVFELVKGGSGKWTYKVLHRFRDKGGADPGAGLIFDAAGNLYGTTFSGGAHDNGTVFQLTPNANGKWTENVLHSFNFSNQDGYSPLAGLIFDAAGNLYGTTSGGGTGGYGIVFELKADGRGKWTESVLHNFNGSDGYRPSAELVFDAAGNLYGTTYLGGSHCGYDGCGTVFQLTPGTDGKWTENVLHNFDDNGKDGNHPHARLIFDAAGNLYGTTLEGGRGSYSEGVVFKLTPGASGKWAETVLNSFRGEGGLFPYDGLVLDTLGNLYGTTNQGGGSQRGVVFEITQ